MLQQLFTGYRVRLFIRLVISTWTQAFLSLYLFPDLIWVDIGQHLSNG